MSALDLATAPQAQRGAARDDDFVNVALWAAQAVVGFLFCFFGLFKLTGPMADLVKELRWPGDYPVLLTRSLGLIDILGGIGIVLPALTRILPQLTVWAAGGAGLLQLLAIAFHASRGEFAVLWLNALLLPLAAWVAWGRSRRVVIAPLSGAEARRRALVITLWAAQCALALVLVGAGVAKFNTPIPELAQVMPWVGDVPPLFVRAVALVDLAGGVGILLPALTRILPRLTVLAGLGIVVLQLLAMALHGSRAEWQVLPLNGLLATLAVYVAWGRQLAAPVPSLERAAARRRFFVFTLWSAQAFVSAVFIGAGLFKLSAPIPELATAMKWPGEFAPALVRVIGAIDVAGGLGILLPALTRILPRLTMLAALGCAVLQVLAIAFHVSRGEWSVLTLNFVLLPCALYVLWGRGTVEPIAPRD